MFYRSKWKDGQSKEVIYVKNIFIVVIIHFEQTVWT